MKDMTKQSRNKNCSQYNQQKISQPKFPRIQHPGSPLAPWLSGIFILPLIGKGREREMAPRPVAGPVFVRGPRSADGANSEPRISWTRPGGGCGWQIAQRIRDSDA